MSNSLVNFLSTDLFTAPSALDEFRMLTLLICSQKFYKLKRESEKLLAEGPGSPGSAPATPAPKTKAAKTPGTKSGGKRKKASTAGDDEAGSQKAPSKAKKVKTEAKTEVKEEGPEEEPKVKAEEEGYDQEIMAQECCDPNNG